MTSFVLVFSLAHFTSLQMEQKNLRNINAK